LGELFEKRRVLMSKIHHYPHLVEHIDENRRLPAGVFSDPKTNPVLHHPKCFDMLGFGKIPQPGTLGGFRFKTSADTDFEALEPLEVLVVLGILPEGASPDPQDVAEQSPHRRIGREGIGVASLIRKRNPVMRLGLVEDKAQSLIGVATHHF
jgi:hypothetical protein